MTIARGMVVTLTVVGVMTFGGGAAMASPPAVCPPPPPAYAPATPPTTTADTDAIVGELRVMRQENAAICATEVASTDAASAAIATKGDATVAAINATPGGSSATASTVKLSPTAPLPDEMVKAYNGMREVLWVLAGLVVVQLVSPYVARVFRWGHR